LFCVTEKCNHYSVSSSRRLSSTKNSLVDLAFNMAPGATVEKVSNYRTKPLCPDVKTDPRAFQRCRQEYSAMTLDLSQRPFPIQSKQAFLLLNKVAVLKGSMEPADVTGFLSKLSHLHQEQAPLVREDTRFIMLLRYAVENLRYFTNSQLLEVLTSFVWLGLPSTHSMLGLYEAELCRRAGELGLHELLLAADLWRCLGRAVPQYLQCLYDSASLHLSQVGVPELVQLMYVIGEGRRCPTELVQPLEQILQRNLPHLEPEEIGTVCLGLFKSQTTLSAGVVKRLVDRAHSVVYEMSDFAVVNVLKLLRFSYLDHQVWLEVMAHEVPRRAPGMGVQALMHVALTCSALHYRDERILLAVAKRLPSLAPHCRSKDAGKLMWAFGSLGVSPSQCPDFYPSLIEAVRQREAEFQRYPEHLLTGLLGLAFTCQFPEDLLALALSPEFVSLASKSRQLELKKDLFTLDGTVALELPHWTGPRLSRELREETTEMLWRFAQKDVCQKAEVLEAEDVLRNLLGGEQFVSKRMILPHTRSIDLEVHLDPGGQVLPLTSGWEKVNTGITLTEDLLAELTNGRKTKTPLPSTQAAQRPLLQRTEPDEGGRLFSVGVDLTDGLIGALIKRGNPAPRGNHKDSKSPVRLAIQVTNRNHFCYHSERLLGLHAMKRRQLVLSGYRVVELPHREWFPLLRRTRAEKMAYMHCKVFGTLD
uniref:RAP domain-containing protein n=1 Tax=Esox lucius TaxID=8010 RepID=A0A3P8YH76_ESOLU